MRFRTPWPEETKLALKALAESGYSASQAASHFPGMTRNAAVGLAFREKFHFHGKGGGPHRKAKTVSKRTYLEIGEPEIRSGMLTLAELRADSCRWPHGDPKDVDFRYCGQRQVAWPYCLAHCRAAYESPEQRRAIQNTVGAAGAD